MQDLSIPNQPPPFLNLLAHGLRWQLVTALARSDYRVQELVMHVGRPMNLVSYHLRQLRQNQLVMERRSSADARDVYYSLDLERLRHLIKHAGRDLHPALNFAAQASVDPVRNLHGKATRVLFLCTRNSARSQMAEGLLRHLSNGQVDVSSAGSLPAPVHPYAIQAMAKMGIDISHQQSKHVDAFRGQTFDYTITVCDIAREDCPVFSDETACLHWSIPDPVAADIEHAQLLVNWEAETDIANFVQVSHDLATRCRHLLALL